MGFGNKSNGEHAELKFNVESITSFKFITRYFVHPWGDFVNNVCRIRPCARQVWQYGLLRVTYKYCCYMGELTTHPLEVEATWVICMAKEQSNLWHTDESSVWDSNTHYPMGISYSRDKGWSCAVFVCGATEGSGQVTGSTCERIITQNSPFCDIKFWL